MTKIVVLNRTSGEQKIHTQKWFQQSVTEWHFHKCPVGTTGYVDSTIWLLEYKQDDLLSRMRCNKSITESMKMQKKHTEKRLNKWAWSRDEFSGPISILRVQEGAQYNAGLHGYESPWGSNLTCVTISNNLIINSEVKVNWGERRHM